MTNTDQLHCSICFVVDGKFTESEDLSLPDLPVEHIINILIKKLNLQAYLEAPQYGRPTLHRFDDAQSDLDTKLGAPLAFSQNLSQAGIKSGSKICLVITPQYLPITIHWSAGSKKGRIAKNLATGASIEEHINSLIHELQLRERVDGPMKSVASLHLTADGPPLPPNMTLLQLKLHAYSQLWLKVEPRFLPVTLQVQFPAGDVHEEQRYVPADRPITEIRDDLIKTIPAVRDAVNGKERCRADLCRNGAALPLDQSLRDLAVPENAALQLVLTPTMAEVTLQLPIGADGQYQPIPKMLPLNTPIRELINTIARDYQLLGEKVTLAPSLQAPAWQAEKTLADYGVKTGAEIWARLKAQAYPPFIVIGGAALAAVVLIAIILAVWLSSGRAVAEVPLAASTTSAPTPTPSPAPPTQTPTPLPTPTRTADEQKRYDFAVGLEAYDRQDWPAAAKAFKQVFAIDPAYLDVGEKLAATHYNWAVHTLTGPEQARQALAIVRETFVFSPTHQLGRELEAKLDGYLRGVEAVAAGDLVTAVAALEQVAASDPAFLDAAAQLYEASLALSRQQREANQLDAALATCTRAAAIPNVDTSAARRCVAELQPTPTPRPRPTPTPEPRLFVYRKDSDPTKPSCISIRIVGIASTGWYFTVDGLGYRGNFQGGDAATCQLQPGQEVTFSIYDANGRLVRGGGGIPAKGGDIFIGEWRR